MPGSELLLFDGAIATPVSSGPFEPGGEYELASWANQGAGIAAASQGAPAYRPVWGPGLSLGAMAGVPYVKFSGAQALSMVGGFWGDGTTTSGTPWSMIAVVEQTGSGTRRLLQGGGNVLFGYTSSRLASYSGTQSAYREVESGTPTTPRTNVQSVVMTSSNTRGWINRAEANASPAAAGVSNHNGGDAFLGASLATGASGFVGKMYLIALYNRALTTDELAAAWNYLEGRFPGAFA